MKNLRYINCIEINEYDTIVASKEQTTRTVLQTIRPNISIDYNQYNSNFANIINRPVSSYINSQALSLRHCYKGKTKARDNLIKKIIEEQTVEMQSICGYCLFYKQTEIDHYIPQEKYSEFSILPSNLLPCCSKCNKTKNKNWRENGERIFLHLYKDTIPNIQFLFGTLTQINNIPTVTFRITNNGGINAALFSIINNHFSKLHLLDLYKKGVPKLISDIKTDVNSYTKVSGNTADIQTIKSLLESKADEQETHCGTNYWEVVARRILAGDNNFLSSLIN